MLVNPQVDVLWAPQLAASYVLFGGRDKQVLVEVNFKVAVALIVLLPSVLVLVGVSHQKCLQTLLLTGLAAGCVCASCSTIGSTTTIPFVTFIMLTYSISHIHNSFSLECPPLLWMPQMSLPLTLNSGVPGSLLGLTYYTPGPLLQLSPWNKHSSALSEGNLQSTVNVHYQQSS